MRAAFGCPGRRDQAPIGRSLTTTETAGTRLRERQAEAKIDWLSRADQLGDEPPRRPLNEDTLRRRELSEAMLSAIPGLQDLALTTNGVLLTEKAAALSAC